MAYDTYAVFAATYPSEHDAVADYEAVEALYYELGAMDTFDAVVITKTDDGKVHIAKKHEQPTRHGAWLGGGIGLGAGLLVALFPAVGLAGAVLVGTAGGAGIGALAGHVTGGMSRHDLKELGEHLDAGTTGLVVVAALDLEERVRHLLKAADKVARKELRAEHKQLEQELEAARTQSGAGGS
jgi:uncharacterized membrane protein